MFEQGPKRTNYTAVYVHMHACSDDGKEYKSDTCLHAAMVGRNTSQTHACMQRYGKEYKTDTCIMHAAIW